MTTYHPVRSVAELARLCEKAPRVFIVFLQHNLISRKVIRFDARTKRFHIINCIDDSRQTLRPEQLHERGLTIIGEAIDQRAFSLEE